MKIISFGILYFVLILHGICKHSEARFDSATTATYKADEKNSNKYKKLLKFVEKKFLNFMGLTAKPDKNLKRKVKVPDHMWKLYYKWSNENFQDYNKNNADTARVIYNDVEEDHVMRSRLRFNLSGITAKEKIHGVDLLLYSQSGMMHRRHRRSNFVAVNHLNPQNSKDKKIARVKKIRNDRIGYVKFDVTQAVVATVNKFGNSDILFDVSDDYNTDTLHLRQRRDVAKSEWRKKRPLLVVYTASSNHVVKRNIRQKRGIYDIKRKKNYKVLNETHERVRRETCRLRHFYLEFNDVGWHEWILAPTGYAINYCSGDCPRPLGPHFNTTNHAIIQNSVLALTKGLVPPLCCIPTTLKDQTFLYLDNAGKLVLKNPNQMVAAGCGCR